MICTGRRALTIAAMTAAEIMRVEAHIRKFDHSQNLADPCWLWARSVRAKTRLRLNGQISHLL
jgi:hypothetical protein